MSHLTLPSDPSHAMPSSSTWSGRRVWLTGHTGFKGSWLAWWLSRLGAHVSGYALSPSTDPSLYTLASLQDVVDDVRGDVRDLQSLSRAISHAAPDIVFHLAAQSLVRRSFVDPIGTLSVNVMGTAHVLEAVRTAPSVRAVVIVSSDKCYLNNDLELRFTEDDPLGGYDVYSSSKACAELISASYRSSFLAPAAGRDHNVLVASARSGNVIGGGDWAEDRLIPDLARAVASGTSVQIRRPNAVRPWQHVLEPLNGYLLLGERLLAGDSSIASAFNFGPRAESERSVESIVREATAIWGGKPAVTYDRSEHPHEAHVLKLDATRAMQRLGWKPRWSIDESLLRTISWYDRVAVDSRISSVRAALDADLYAFTQAPTS